MAVLMADCSVEGLDYRMVGKTVLQKVVYLVDSMACHLVVMLVVSMAVWKVD
jgi:hypothetical protein